MILWEWLRERRHVIGELQSRGRGVFYNKHKVRCGQGRSNEEQRVALLQAGDGIFMRVFAKSPSAVDSTNHSAPDPLLILARSAPHVWSGEVSRQTCGLRNTA